jgi:hypothetical protein
MDILFTLVPRYLILLVKANIPLTRKELEDTDDFGHAAMDEVGDAAGGRGRDSQQERKAASQAD